MSELPPQEKIAQKALAQKQQAAPLGPVFTPEDAAAYLALTRRTLDKLFEQGRLRFYYCGRLRRTTQPWCDEFIADCIRESTDRLYENGEVAEE